MFQARPRKLMGKANLSTKITSANNYKNKYRKLVNPETLYYKNPSFLGCLNAKTSEIFDDFSITNC